MQYEDLFFKRKDSLSPQHRVRAAIECYLIDNYDIDREKKLDCEFKSSDRKIFEEKLSDLGIVNGGGLTAYGKHILSNFSVFYSDEKCAHVQKQVENSSGQDRVREVLSCMPGLCFSEIRKFITNDSSVHTARKKRSILEFAYNRSRTVVYFVVKDYDILFTPDTSGSQ